MLFDATNATFLAVGAGFSAFFMLLYLAWRFLALKPAAVGGSINANRRSLARFSVTYQANIRMLDEEGPGARVALTDLSEYGGRIRCRSALPAGARLRLQIPELKSAATAHVRTCTKRWFGYEIGLEFQGTLYRTCI